MSAAPSVPKPMYILGVPVAPFVSYDHAIRCVEDVITFRRKSFWVAVNPEKVYRAMHDPNLHGILRRADAGICDGVGISIAARLLYGQGIRRCTGVDLFFTLMGAASRRGWKVFLLGASPESNERAYQRLLVRYPGLQVAGRCDGFFQDSARAIRQINDSGADLLFVAMGSPRQEFWIAEHRGELNVPFCLGVGGSFDIASGSVRRAPRIFRATGTEFLFRFLAEPRRWRRQASRPLFMLMVLRAKLFGGQPSA